MQHRGGWSGFVYGQFVFEAAADVVGDMGVFGAAANGSICDGCGCGIGFCEHGTRYDLCFARV